MLYICSSSTPNSLTRVLISIFSANIFSCVSVAFALSFLTLIPLFLFFIFCITGIFCIYPYPLAYKLLLSFCIFVCCFTLDTLVCQTDAKAIIIDAIIMQLTITIPLVTFCEFFFISLCELLCHLCIPLMNNSSLSLFFLLGSYNFKASSSLYYLLFSLYFYYIHIYSPLLSIEIIYIHYFVMD